MKKTLIAATFALACLGAAAQAWPAKPITLVVPFAAGGPTDVVARTLAASMTKTLGQTVVVENKLGAGGTVAASFVAKAAPDGYTFFIHHNGMATATALYRKLPYNPLTDFEFVSQVVDVPMTLLAARTFPPTTCRELIAYVKANAAKINLANAGLGAVSQLCGMLFQQALGRRAHRRAVPGHRAGDERAARRPGRHPVRPDHADHPADQGGQRQVLRRDHAARIKALPDAPTLHEQGLKDFEVVVWHGIYAPKGTPKRGDRPLNTACAPR